MSLVHLGYSLTYHILIFLYHICVRCYTFYWILKEEFHKFRNLGMNGTSIIKAISDKAKSFRKIPRHLTVILKDEEASYKDFANVVLWSSFTGIQYVSFYDYKGKLKHDETKLHHVIEELLHLHSCHLIWHCDNGIKSKNGFTGRKVNVKVFSPEDGRKEITETCKSLVAEEDLTINLVDSALRQAYKFPDPELAFYNGDYLNLTGYPPWQVSLTEFLCVRTYCRLNYLTFINLLERYNRCEQRVGK